jgi:hypothetical protein
MINEQTQLLNLLERIAVALENKGGGTKVSKAKGRPKKEGGWGNPNADNLPVATIFGSNSIFYEYLKKFIDGNKAVGNTEISTRRLAKMIRKEKKLDGKGITFYNALFDNDKYKQFGLKKVSQYKFEIV